MKRMLLLACMTLGMMSCEKDPDFGQMDANLVVYTDHDNNVDFGKYQTYFLPDSILEIGGYKATYWKDENAMQLISKVEQYMNERGYTRLTEPEQKEDANIGLQLSYLAQSTQIVTGGYWNGWWNWGFWGDWWGGWYYPYPVSYSYDTNALIIEMVDLTSKEEGGENKQLPVVWYASASGYSYGNGKNNLLFLLDGVDQAFAQSDYITRNN